ncbi:MAG: hypothetical protein ACR2PR_06915 [Pseudohongiellaceae bacterium]
MPKSFSQFDQGEGAKYAAKPKKKTASRRTPSRKKQAARGRTFDQMARSQAESARKAMKRGRHSAPGD